MHIARPRSQIGLLLRVDQDSAKIIIERIGQLSIPFGTKIEFEDGGIGVVRLS
jgi:hypothetical protein